MDNLTEGLTQGTHQMRGHYRRIPSLATWRCTRKAKFKRTHQRTPRVVCKRSQSAHSLAAVIENVVDPACSISIRREETTIDQPPKVEDAADNVRISTLVDTARRGIPFVARGLSRFVKRCVKHDVVRRVKGVRRGYAEGMPIRWDTKDHLLDRETSFGPSLHG
jgi:hypothetical protein